MRFDAILKPFNRVSLASFVKTILLVTATFLFGVSANAQFAASWPLTSDGTGAVTGPQAASVTAGTMTWAPNFAASASFTTQGFVCKQDIGNWPDAPDDAYSVDFPLSPAGAKDIVISGLTFTSKQSGGSNNTLLSLAYQAAGSGTWTAFGIPQVAASGGTRDIDFGALNTTLTAGTTYTIRMYIYADGTGTSKSRSVTLKDVVFTGSVVAIAPTVSTTTISGVTALSANTGGNVTDDGGAAIIERGVVYSSTNFPPTTADTKVVDGATGTGSYSSSLTGLTPSTTYHVRAYAINNINTSYGGDSVFTTLAPSPTLVAIPSALDFGSVSQYKTSAEQTYTLSGFFLNAGPATVTVTAPAGYEVSLTTGTGFGTSVTVPYTGTDLAATTIYIRFKPKAIASYNGNITNSVEGAPIQNVSVTGEGVPQGLQFQSSFSNKGTDFWTGFGPHEKSSNADGSNNNAQMTLYFTSDDTATVTIYVGNNLVETLSLPKGAITASQQLPWTGTDDARLIDENVYVGKGIYIHSTSPIVAYASINGSKVAAATVLFPVNTLGRSYTALNYTQLSNASGNSSARSYCFAVATEDNTNVEVTLPAGITSETGLTGVNTKILNKGDVWLIKASDGFTDITGTQMKSISSDGSACKPIAVFSGSGKIAISCDGSTPSSDNLFQQAFPTVAWGKNYVSAPTGGTNYSFNVYRVMINPDSTQTQVTVNGVALPNANPIPGISSANPVNPGATIGLTNNLYYEFGASVPVVISTNSPVMVAQYITNADKCTNNYKDNGGDPDMVYLSSVEQTIDSIIVSPVPTSSTAVNYINVVTKTADVSKFSITDAFGNVLPANFNAIDATYSYAQIEVQPGYDPAVFYKLYSTGDGFNAISYGYASSESYAYNAGTSLNNLSSAISVNNKYSLGDAASVCKGSEFTMSVILPYSNTQQIIFDYSNNANLSPNTSDILNNPVPSGSFVSAGQTFYVFTNTVPHTYNALTPLQVKVLAQNPTSDGCSLQQFLFQIAVTQGPTASFSFPPVSGCFGTVQFTDLSTGNGGILNRWVWDYGDGTPISSDSTIQNPSHEYKIGGDLTVKLRSITEEGCYGDTSKIISFSGAPLADFTIVPVTGCVDVPLKFTDVSTISSGTLTNAAFDFGDGSAPVTVNPGGSADHVYAQAQTYSVTLTATSSTGCIGIKKKDVIVNPSPEVDAGPPVTTPFNVPATLLGSASQATYLWTPGGDLSDATTLRPLANPKQTTLYTLTATLDGCSVSDTMTLTVELPCEIKPSGAFTPNGDGKNDLWLVGAINNSCVIAVDVNVYNRWGARVFQGKNYQNNWNGEYNGHPLPDGTYYYIVYYRTALSQYPYTVKGNVTILR